MINCERQKRREDWRFRDYTINKSVDANAKVQAETVNSGHKSHLEALGVTKGGNAEAVAPQIEDQETVASIKKVSVLTEREAYSKMTTADTLKLYDDAIKDPFKVAHEYIEKYNKMESVEEFAATDGATQTDLMEDCAKQLEISHEMTTLESTSENSANLTNFFEKANKRARFNSVGNTSTACASTGLDTDSVSASIGMESESIIFSEFSNLKDFSKNAKANSSRMMDISAHLPVAQAKERHQTGTVHVGKLCVLPSQRAGAQRNAPSKEITTIPVEKPIEIGKSCVYKWVVKSYELSTDSKGQCHRIPIYSSLGDGMYGQVFEVQSGPRVYAAKVIYMNDRNNPHILSADTLREIALYQELHDLQANAFPHLPKFYGFKVLHHFSDYFAERYLRKCKRCSILILERCEQTFKHFACMNSSRINVNWIKFYLWQLLNALAKLHSQNLSHRDLKPENLLVSSVKKENEEESEYLKGVHFLKISDLGMGRKLRNGFALGDAGGNGPIEFFDEPKSGGSKTSSISTSMAQTGVVITLPYRPPELLLADALVKDASGSHIAHYGKACDIWSAGVIFGELCLLPRTDSKHWTYLFYSRKYEGAYHGKIFMMLTNIFKLLGSPTESDCAHLKSINKSQWPLLEPYLSSFSSLSDLERLYSLNSLIESHSGIRLDYYGLDLLSRLLAFDPSKRLSARDALAHPFFESLPYEEMNSLGFISWLNHLEDPHLSRYLKPYSREQLKAWTDAGGSLKDTKLGLRIHQRPLTALSNRTANPHKVETRSASQSHLPNHQKSNADEKEGEGEQMGGQMDVENQAMNLRRSKRTIASTSALPAMVEGSGEKRTCLGDANKLNQKKGLRGASPSQDGRKALRQT